MKLKYKIGARTIKVINVEPSDNLYILFYKLKISDKNIKLVLNGTTYSMISILTFEEIGLNFDARITVNTQAIAGNI